MIAELAAKGIQSGQHVVNPDPVVLFSSSVNDIEGGPCLRQSDFRMIAELAAKGIQSGQHVVNSDPVAVFKSGVGGVEYSLSFLQSYTVAFGEFISQALDTI